MALNNYKKITFEDMVDYIETKAPKDKAWFKENAFALDKFGNYKYNHLKAKKAFCERYMPEIIPPKKEKAPNKTDILKDW